MDQMREFYKIINEYESDFRKCMLGMAELSAKATAQANQLGIPGDVIQTFLYMTREKIFDEMNTDTQEFLRNGVEE